MPAVIDRIVDAHMHLWDRTRTDWYPYLHEAGAPLDDQPTGIHRSYAVSDYRHDTTGWNVQKAVHVAAARPPHEIAETDELQQLGERTGLPAAIIGSISVRSEVPAAMRTLAGMVRSPRFRGLRVTGDDTGVPATEVLEALVEADLVLDLMVRSNRLQAAAAALDGWTELTVVVEHAGWPRGGSADEFAQWQRDMAHLAGISDRMHCKVSGLAMPLRSMSVGVLRPWVEHCLDVFGVDRCLFASNFPVDSACGTFDDLYSSYADICAALGHAEQDKLFAANAERVYRC